MSVDFRRVEVRLPKELADQLERLARAEQRSLAGQALHLVVPNLRRRRPHPGVPAKPASMAGGEERT